MRGRIVASLSIGLWPFAVSACAGASNPGAAHATKASVGDGRRAPREPQKAIGIATGDFHTCAVVVGGSVFCWGRDRDGELGDGATAGNQTHPLGVPNLREVEEVAAGNGFSCARMKSGKVRCWGSGKILGDGRAVEKIRPTEVEGVDGAIDLKAGGFVACARTQAGAVHCWGTDRIQSGAPSAGAEEIAVAGAHACAGRLDGTVPCWGEGLAARPGRASHAAQVLDVAKATAISTGDTFVCAIVAAQPRCWGRNDEGELGVNPDKETRTKPALVKNVNGIVKLSSAEARTCALGKDETVRCWGSNQDGELGRGMQSTSEPAGVVEGLAGVAEIAVGAGHVCARTREGALYCWGGKRQGQLGDGTNERRPQPVPVVW
jgi:alpha-tubulin suppressor-like RCC1 family protein